MKKIGRFLWNASSFFQKKGEQSYGDSDRTTGSGHGEIQHEGGIRGFGRKPERVCGVCGERTDKVRRATDSERPHGQAEEVLYRPGDKSLVENLIKVRR